MRIRKRFPPPSESDPQLNRPVVVQQLKREINPCPETTKNEYLPSDLPNLTISQPSDQPAVSRGKATTWVFFGGNSNQQKMKEKDVEAEDEKLWRENEKSFGSNDNDNNKQSFSTTPQLGSLFPQPSSSSDLDGRWCEGDKVIPFKKRRDSYNHTSNINTIEAKMKSKTNKKCPQENDQEEKEGGNGLITKEGFGVNKKSKRGSVILEGSRCSRVNGRGWRCCQQTLVGYSLCEHHLGKGRLRSMTSVRNATKKKQEEEEEENPLSNDNMEDHYDGEDDKKKPLMKKMKRLGVVKARSLSSLLGQTDNVVAAFVVDNIKKD
ncbi:PREDICTED: uncharacterized protein LOC109242085 [Nicotiana attenuata]|uniref:WRC domain-containing protein n=1 Tax=Nicotiana attenuata TaxID=49451 RepID=A0A314L4E8_NICAT|nr:PREDICTED: uncharacterized protein LOC109242085 [Nicotiana attenuata]OIT36412.1 hypothetical protein A4A49_16861 [Nicotiana attenuata]